MRFRRAAVSVIVAGSLGLIGTDSHAVSMEEELLSVYMNHPTINAGRKGLESSREDVAVARSDYYPTVSVSGEYGPDFLDNPTTRSAQDDAKDFFAVRTTAGVTVTQNLFNGYATSSSVQAAEITSDLERETLEETTQDTIYQAIEAYINVLRQKKLLELSFQNEKNIQTQLDLEDEKVRRGSGIEVNVLTAKSKLQIAKQERVDVEKDLINSIDDYIQIFDHAPDVEGMVDPVAPVDYLPAELEEALDIALRENPEIGKGQASVEAARQTRRGVIAEYFPTIDLEGAWNYEKDRAGTVGTRRDYTLLLTAEWDLYTGGSTRHNMSAAAYDYGKSKDELQQVEREIIASVRKAWTELVKAREKIGLFENAVNIAAEQHEARKKLREAGKETVINVLDAEKELFDARLKLADIFYGEKLAVYQLMLSMGRLTPGALGLALN